MAKATLTVKLEGTRMVSMTLTRKGHIPKIDRHEFATAEEAEAAMLRAFDVARALPGVTRATLVAA